jgi:hypothetical protein
MTNINLPPSSNPAPKPELLTEQSLIQERLRQARLSFNLALVLTATSGLVGIAGVVLLFSGKVPEGTITTAGGLASNIVSVRCLKLTKDANDRLDQMAKHLKDED